MADKPAGKKVKSEKEWLEVVAAGISQEGYALTNNAEIPAVPGETPLEQQVRLMAKMIAGLRGGQQ